MRTPEEMFELIKKVAFEDENILAVYYGGSRANPTIKPDIYQDYDVVFVVKEVEPYTKDHSFVEKFGEILLMQEPDLMDANAGLIPYDFSEEYAFLTIFKDGNRMDISLHTLEAANKELAEDKMNVILLDKNHYLKKTGDSTDEDYHNKIPTQLQLDACSNEFFWCLNNVVKAIARDELTYAHTMYNVYVKKQYYIMIDWMLGVRYEGSISSGKLGKFYKKYLSPEEYTLLCKSFPNESYDSFWSAIDSLIELFLYAAHYVADKTSLSYSEADAAGLKEYLYKVKNGEYHY